MKVSSKISSAVISVAIGVLFIVLKGSVISITMTLIGVAAIIMAVVDFANNETKSGVIKCIIGVAVLILGWLLVDIALYAISGVLIILGVSQIVSAIRLSGFCNSVQKVFMIIKPVATLGAGFCLLFNKGGTTDTIFVIVGVLVLVEGMLSLVDPVEKKK